MLKLSILFGVLALLMIWWNLWISLQIVKYLQEKNRPASLFRGGFFVKGKIFSYLPVYKKVTTEEYGRPGSLYGRFYISFFGMVLFFLLGIATAMA